MIRRGTLRVTALLAALAVALPGTALSEEAPAKSLDQLLQEVRQGRSEDLAENRRRIQEFETKRNEQAALLRRERGERARQEGLSDTLEKTFQDNELQIAALEQQLRQRQGSLGELFGVVRQVAGDTRGVVENSITSAQIPGRAAPLDDLAQSKQLPNMERLRDLWFRLQQEMTETGKTVRFTTDVVKPNGESEAREVVRVGAFTAISDGRFLKWDPPTATLQELNRQPGGRYLRAASSYEGTSSGVAEVAIDPSKGSILGLLVQAPTAGERVDQGGIIGYVIITLGVIGVLLSIERFVSLFLVGRKMQSQTQADSARSDNPLGRVMGVYEENPDADTETLELRLDESVLREVPKLERFLTTIKVLSAIAPLLGLLGTVTGMIETFQMITLFGTGDPKMMASGISEALVTTMLGLIVAIPLTFLHSVCRDRSKALVEMLEEQSAGMVATRAEARGQTVA
ncbi:MAG: MotA/TolQ/ExbB proton channel family protein [Proteobacteria bacterium]|nr:MotA/TolQ/ExbB proton channel family protein [Pseudomonadota bacterium]